jgi:D-serine deaminase-like pyridoxal phosphate-dependent protein
MTKDDLTTPVLTADLDVMERNLERMAAFFRTGSTRLRPHFKNHKCPDLAWRQLDAGAIGITCATLGEAECLVHHGVRSVLLANEIVDSAKIRGFVDLARRADVIVCIDDEKFAGEIAREAGNRRTQVSVLVDVDVACIVVASLRARLQLLWLAGRLNWDCAFVDSWDMKGMYCASRQDPKRPRKRQPR